MKAIAREIGRTVRFALEGWHPTARLIAIMGVSALLIAVLRMQ